MTNNLDPNEISKFNALAAKWWDPSGEMKPLHLLNPLRLQYIQEQVDLADKNVLDVGCGGGLLSEAMAKVGAKVTGIDLSDQLIKVAKQHAQSSGLSIDYQLSAVENLAPTTKFDVITCMEMLEHVPDPESIIKTCQQLLKPGGWFFLATINRNPKAYLSAIIGAEYLLKMLPRGTHNYAQFIKPSEITLWASRVDLQLGGVKGIAYNPLNGQFSLSQDVSVNYLIYFQKP